MKDVETDDTVGHTQFLWLSVDLMKEMNGLFNWFWRKKHIHKLNFMIQLSYTKQLNLYTKASVNKLLIKTVFSTKIWKLDVEFVYV